MARVASGEFRQHLAMASDNAFAARNADPCSICRINVIEFDGAIIIQKVFAGYVV